MPELTPDIAAVVRAACEKNADEAAGSFSRTFESTISVTVGGEGRFEADPSAAGFDGPGLLVLLKFGAVGVVGVFPESSGLLPAWYADANATTQSKLTTLAQELSMLLMPEEFMADDFKAAKVPHLAAALEQAGVATGAGLVPLSISAGEQTATFSLVWPCPTPDKLYTATAAKTPVPDLEPTPAIPPTRRSGFAPFAPGATLASVEDLRQLPSYTRSLLRIKVPVMVTLASKKQSIHQIVELGAGSIIKFDKSCEEMLELEVGGLPIALGEAVKVGDKFGLRINSMILPGERFEKLHPKRRGA